MQGSMRRRKGVAKKRILMKVEEPLVNMQQSPLAAYYVQQNMECGGTRISSLGSQSYVSDKSTVVFTELENEIEKERRAKSSRAPEKVKIQSERKPHYIT
jgi:hypothetical protein